MSRPNVIFLVLFCLVTALTIGGGILFMDSPHIARAKSLDRKRVQDVIAIVNAVQKHRQQHKQLPADFDDLIRIGPNSLFGKTADPETLRPYQYKVTGENSFKVCMQFATESDMRELAQNDTLAPWRHGAGHVCYMFKGQSTLPQSICTDCQEPDPHIKL